MAASITYTCVVQCSPASVGVAQARPNNLVTPLPYPITISIHSTFKLKNVFAKQHTRPVVIATPGDQE